MSANLHKVAPDGASQVVELPTAHKLHDPILLQLTPPDKVGMVSVRNVLIVLAYLQKKMGFSQEEAHRIMFPERYENEEGRQEVPRHQRLSRPLDIYLQENELFPLADWLILVQRFLDIAGTRRILQEAGANSTRLRTLDLVKSAIKLFRKMADGPIAAYRLTPVLNTRFNRTKVFNIMDETRDEKTGQVVGCTFMVTFYPGIDPVTDWCSDPWIRGILADVPNAWKADQAEVKVPVLPYKLVNLLRREYGLDAHEDDQGNVWLDGQKIGRRVYLLPERSSQAGLDYYPGRYVEEYQRGAHQATLVLRDLFIPEDGQDEDWLVVKRGEIYEAPSFIINVSWKVQGLFKLLTMVRNSRKWLLSLLAWPLSSLQKRLNIQIHRQTQELSLLELRLEQATGQLEAVNQALLTAKEAAEDERTEAQRAREEAERWKATAQQVFRQQAPDAETAELVAQGRFLRQSRTVCTVILDIPNSTGRLSKSAPGEFVDYLERVFTPIRRIVNKHEGWIANTMGDGLLIVFGWNQGDEDPCGQAMRACTEIQTNLILNQDQPVYIGVSFGGVVFYVPEGTSKIESIGIPINTAARLCDLKRPGEIMVCELTSSLVPGCVQEEKVELKGLGPRYYYSAPIC